MQVVTMHIDWLSATYPPATSLSDLTPLTGQVTFMGHGLKGYKTGYKSETGALIFGNGTSEMGVHVILSGEPLGILRDEGQGDKQVIDFMRDKGGRPSRIDLAMNLHNSPLTVDDFHQAWEQRQIRTPARSGWRHKGVNCDDDGLYIGKETSDRRARVYDKAAERNVKDKEAWLRLELQCRDLRARAISGAMGEFAPDTVIRAAISDFIGWDNPHYQAALTGPIAPVSPIGRKEPSFVKWLEKQVIPAFVNYQRNNPDSDVLELFHKMWAKHLEGGDTTSQQGGGE